MTETEIIKRLMVFGGVTERELAEERGVSVPTVNERLRSDAPWRKDTFPRYVEALVAILTRRTGLPDEITINGEVYQRKHKK